MLTFLEIQRKVDQICEKIGLEKKNKRSRAKKSMPSRKAQKAVIEQRNLNPVLDSCG